MTGFNLELHQGVLRVGLAHPPRNTLTRPLMTELAAAMRRLAKAQGPARPRAILLASDVRGQFCHGIDPEAVLATDVAGRTAIFMALADLVEAFWFSYIPVVCDVSGPALAGGAVLATLGDFAIVDTHAGKICFSEVKVGLPLPQFVQRLVERKVMPAAWADVMLLGRNVDATLAVKIGFANAAYSEDTERDEMLQGILGRILRLAPEVVSATLREGRAREFGLLQEFRQDSGRFAAFLTDAYLGKGLAAVLRGEAPQF